MLWPQWSVRQRLDVVRRLRGLIADHGGELAAAVPRDPAETLVAEVLPFAEACRFLEREAEELLAPRRPSRGRPLWLSGTTLEIVREPLGKVLVIGPANYPLLLPAVHTLQALVAGNYVLVKPGRGGSFPMRIVKGLLEEAGLPHGVLTLLSEDPQDAVYAIEEGVDKVILTGSNATGQVVMRTLADHLVPSVMELSGCDSVFVLDDADLDLVAGAVRFGLTLNNGDTCIAPKRLYVSKARAADLHTRLGPLRIPVVPVDSIEDALQRSEQCGFGLGASVFGSTEAARNLASRIKAGVVVINDMIVPTADPRLPFGGRGKSGFGVTRGAEGLLEMTAVKAISVRAGKWRPHFEARQASDSQMFQGVLKALHSASWRRRFDGILQLSRAAMARGKAA
jgi:aldehyde dehydrogenase (NAD+)